MTDLIGGFMWRSLVLAVLFAVLTACVSPALAPGADKVRITDKPSDVANCKAVGNLPSDSYASNAVSLRNKTIGLGGNTAFVTPGSGIAYQCP